MKKEMGILLLLGVFVFVGTNAIALPIQVGDQVKVNSYGPSIFGDSGGEFDMEANNGYEWISYCIEKHELIYPGNYDWVGGISGQAVGGGGNKDLTEVGYDTLSNESAWLFYQFASDNLSGYDGGDTAQQNLQGALWYLEDELTATQEGQLNQAMLDWIEDAEDAVDAGWTKDGKVYVLNLYESYDSTTGIYSGNRQDVLIASIPDASTLLLLGSAFLVGFGALGRRRS